VLERRLMPVHGRLLYPARDIHSICGGPEHRDPVSVSNENYILKFIDNKHLFALIPMPWRSIPRVDAAITRPLEFGSLDSLVFGMELIGKG
jgi:hypothetical protein